MELTGKSRKRGQNTIRKNLNARTNAINPKLLVRRGDEETEIGDLIDAVMGKHGISIDNETIMDKLKEFIKNLTEVDEIDEEVLKYNKKLNLVPKIEANWRHRKVLSIVKHNFEPVMNLEFFNPYLKRIETMCHYQLIFQQFEEEIGLNRPIPKDGGAEGVIQ